MQLRGALHESAPGSQTTHHCNDSADKSEVGEVLGVDSRGRVDLQGVVATTGIL